MNEKEKVIVGCTDCGRIAAATFGQDEVMRGLPCGECSGDLLPANAEWVSAKFDRLSNQLAEKDAEIERLKSEYAGVVEETSATLQQLTADNQRLREAIQKAEDDIYRWTRCNDAPGGIEQIVEHIVQALDATSQEDRLRGSPKPAQGGKDGVE